MENRVLYPYTGPAKKQVSIGVDELLALIVSDATTNKSASSPYKEQKTNHLKMHKYHTSNISSLLCYMYVHCAM